MEGSNNINLELGNVKRWIVLGFLVVVLMLELQVTTSSPIAFGDEGYHVATARVIGTEQLYPKFHPLQGTLLESVTYNRPPMWNFIEGSFYMMFGFSDMFIKILLPLVSFFTGLAAYLLIKKIYSENVAVIAAIILVTIPSFVTYSVFFYTAVPFVFFATIALLSFILSTKMHGRKYLILTGLFTALALLTNIAALFIIATIGIYALLKLAYNLNLQNVVHLAKKYGMLLAIVILFVSPWILRNVIDFYIPECRSLQHILQGTCTKPASYTSTGEFSGRTAEVGTETGILKMGIVPYLQFAYGIYSGNNILNLIGAAFVPFMFVAGLVILGKRRSEQDLIVLISVFVIALMFYFVGGLSFGGRAEDIARYFLNATPIIGLVAGVYADSLLELSHKYKNFILAGIIISILGISLVGVWQKTDSLKGPKQFAPGFFEACEWIEANTQKDATLLSLQTYPTIYNCNRRANWEIPDKGDILLSNNVNLVTERLKLNGINYIFVQKFSMSTEKYGQSYPIDFVNMLETNNNSFHKIYENGPSLDACIQARGCDGALVYKVL